MTFRKTQLRTRLVTAGLAVGASAALAVGLSMSGVASAKVTPTTTHKSSSFNFVTFYGFIDNSPPGRAIAHPGCPNGGHSQAGGTGTRSDPLTVAWPNDLNSFCQIGYVPFIKKYVIHEDQCNPCGGVNTNHWDVWMGGDSGSTHQPEKRALLNCENKMTRHATVILNPPSNEPVDTQPLFTPPTSCNTGA
jgi:hypothetical protein